MKVFDVTSQFDQVTLKKDSGAFETFKTFEEKGFSDVKGEGSRFYQALRSHASASFMEGLRNAVLKDLQA